MYDEYLRKLDEAGKIRNLKERSISCYASIVAEKCLIIIDRNRYFVDIQE